MAARGSPTKPYSALAIRTVPFRSVHRCAEQVGCLRGRTIPAALPLGNPSPLTISLEVPARPSLESDTSPHPSPTPVHNPCAQVHNPAPSPLPSPRPSPPPSSKP